MPDTRPTTADTPEFDNETALEQQARIVREAVLIAEAEAEIDAGRGIDLEDVNAWLRALETDENAPLPMPRSDAR